MAPDGSDRAHREVPMALRPIFFLAERATWISSIALLALAGIVIADVVGRAFNAPLSSGSDIGAMLMVGIIFLSFAGTQAGKDHVSMDALVAAFPPRMRRITDWVGLLICFGVGAFLTYGTFNAAVKSYAIGEMALGALRLPLWYAKSIVAIGFGLYSLVILAQLLGANPEGKVQDSEPPAGAD